MKPKPITIKLSAKCSDLCRVTVLDQDGNEMAENNGYVPGFMPEIHYGDYVMLDIDLETGRILNWKKPTAKQVLKDVADM